MDAEAALIVACPAAEYAVADQRALLDPSARLGVPAHLTVAYPFKAELTAGDHAVLTATCRSIPAFIVRGERTGWFNETVVYVEPVDATPLVALTEAVQAQFPTYPIYGGAFGRLVPHLTVGQGQPQQLLKAAEATVRNRLPFTQEVTHVEMWSGPALVTAAKGSWRRRHRYRLGDRR